MGSYTFVVIRLVYAGDVGDSGKVLRGVVVLVPGYVHFLIVEEMGHCME